MSLINAISAPQHGHFILQSYIPFFVIFSYFCNAQAMRR
jgi:hypothetical protein